MRSLITSLVLLVGMSATVVADIALTNDCATLAFDANGRLVSVKSNADGRELAASATSFIRIRSGNGDFQDADRMEMRDGKLVFYISGGKAGRISLRPARFPGGYSFTVEEAVVPSATHVYVGRMSPSCRRWIGRYANMMSDEKSGVCVRPYDIFSQAGCGEVLYVQMPKARAQGARFGLVAAPRAHLQKALQAMTIVSGRPHSTAGGAWSLGSEVTRGSYLNAHVTADSLDDWIDLMERGGFDVLHFREQWYARRGHYHVNTNDWPNGISDMRAAVAKIHDAGYRAGLHTLTGCIDPDDPWVAGESNADLLAWEMYTLTDDLAPDATELVVAEPPKKRHDTVFTYSGNGNALRIGNEIVQFSAFSEKPPYTYSGLKRGAFGTTAAAHSKGAQVAYLQQRYLAFYPNPDSALADRVVDAIANVYNTCRFDQIYCDGLEGMMSGYGMTVMSDRIVGCCTADGRPCLNEDSCGYLSHTWWFHSRVGAWDWTLYAPKRFHDYHVENMKKRHVREADMLELQMGWWHPSLSGADFPNQKIDDIEYYASRNAGLDASMSIIGIDVSRRPLSFHMSRMMTVLGWYERVRRACAFTSGLIAAFDRPRAEFLFRQDKVDGVWKCAPVQTFSFRVGSSDAGDSGFMLDRRPERAALRVEALYCGEKPNMSNMVHLTHDIAYDSLVTETANTNVTLALSCASAEDGARCLRMTATNRGDTPCGAWARASARFAPHQNLGGGLVLRFRVKGDGSGALLNVQIVSPVEYGGALSEHYVTLDFTGWREFEMPLRERDAARYPDHIWPYKGYGQVFHRLLSRKHISAVNWYLNEIPSHGAVSVEVTDVTVVPQRQNRIAKHCVTVNGQRIAIPFAMDSGDFAELEDGMWTLYARGGKPLLRKPAEDGISIRAGANRIAYEAFAADGTSPRAELTVFVIGEAQPAVKELEGLSIDARRFLSYEAVEPQLFAPEKGFSELERIAVRPGEEARLEVTVHGPMPASILSVGMTSNALPAIASGEHRKFRLAGVHRGVQPVKIRLADGSDGETAARFEFVKRYGSAICPDKTKGNGK